MSGSGFRGQSETLRLLVPDRHDSLFAFHAASHWSWTNFLPCFLRNLRQQVSAASLQSSFNHGYWLADAAIRKQVPELLPANIPSLRVPYPNWAGPEDKIKQALAESNKWPLLGHGSN